MELVKIGVDQLLLPIPLHDRAKATSWDLAATNYYAARSRGILPLLVVLLVVVLLVVVVVLVVKLLVLSVSSALQG
jgi:hypothetical protein